MYFLHIIILHPIGLHRRKRWIRAVIQENIDPIRLRIQRKKYAIKLKIKYNTSIMISEVLLHLLSAINYM
jgi:hypothetical protein